VFSNQKMDRFKNANAQAGRLRLGCMGQIFFIGLMLIGLGVLYVAFNPWAFFMGGNFHPFGTWHGYGRMHSATAGDYFLYIQIYPNMHTKGAIVPGTPVKGDAYLCTPKGERFYLKLGGGMPWGYYVNSLGKPINLYMSNWRTALPVAADERPYLKFSGHWEPGKLVADDRKSLSAAFLPDGTLRPKAASIPPSQTELTQVTFLEGSYSDFKAACAAHR
jgi:hypothetical protein